MTELCHGLSASQSHVVDDYISKNSVSSSKCRFNHTMFVNLYTRRFLFDLFWPKKHLVTKHFGYRILLENYTLNLLWMNERNFSIIPDFEHLNERATKILCVPEFEHVISKSSKNPHYFFFLPRKILKSPIWNSVKLKIPLKVINWNLIHWRSPLTHTFTK